MNQNKYGSWPYTVLRSGTWLHLMDEVRNALKGLADYSFSFVKTW
jgi:hypothetical protein